MLSSCVVGAVFSLDAALLFDEELSLEVDWPPPQAVRPKQRAIVEAAITMVLVIDLTSSTLLLVGR